MTRNRIIEQLMVVSQASVDTHHDYKEVALFGTDGAPVSVTAFTGTGATVLMTGYAGHAAGNVGATDKVNEAVGKLEARIAVLETDLAAAQLTIADHESRIAALEA